MPVKMEMLPGDKVRVSTPGGVKAKATSFQKAMAMKRMMSAVGKMPMTAKPMKPKGMKKKTDGMDDM
jgi:hypothetical protein